MQKTKRASNSEHSIFGTSVNHVVQGYALALSQKKLFIIKKIKENCLNENFEVYLSYRIALKSSRRFLVDLLVDLFKSAFSPPSLESILTDRTTSDVVRRFSHCLSAVIASRRTLEKINSNDDSPNALSLSLSLSLSLYLSIYLSIYLSFFLCSTFSLGLLLSLSLSLSSLSLSLSVQLSLSLSLFNCLSNSLSHYFSFCLNFLPICDSFHLSSQVFSLVKLPNLATVTFCTLRLIVSFMSFLTFFSLFGIPVLRHFPV